jgi:DNA-binding NarL/FixJ family response regulator
VNGVLRLPLLYEEKVIIGDYNSFIREGLKIILNTYEDFDIVTTVNDGKESFEFCKHMR